MPNLCHHVASVFVFSAKVWQRRLLRMGNKSQFLLRTHSKLSDSLKLYASELTNSFYQFWHTFLQLCTVKQWLTMKREGVELERQKRCQEWLHFHNERLITFLVVISVKWSFKAQMETSSMLKNCTSQHRHKFLKIPLIRHLCRPPLLLKLALTESQCPVLLKN